MVIATKHLHVSCNHTCRASLNQNFTGFCICIFRQLQHFIFMILVLLMQLKTFFLFFFHVINMNGVEFALRHSVPMLFSILKWMSTFNALMNLVSGQKTKTSIQHKTITVGTLRHDDWFANNVIKHRSCADDNSLSRLALSLSSTRLFICTVGPSRYVNWYTTLFKDHNLFCKIL